jgi:hypothetical protein
MLEILSEETMRKCRAEGRQGELRVTTQRPVTVVPFYNLSNAGDGERRIVAQDQPGQNLARSHFKKESWVLWCMPEIPTR